MANVLPMPAKLSNYDKAHVTPYFKQLHDKLDQVSSFSSVSSGMATLAAGTATVANTSVTASAMIIATAQDNNTTGSLRISARTPGTNFTITSDNPTDSGVVAWQIFL